MALAGHTMHSNFTIKIHNLYFICTVLFYYTISMKNLNFVHVKSCFVNPGATCDLEITQTKKKLETPELSFALFKKGGNLRLVAKSH